MVLPPTENRPSSLTNNDEMMKYFGALSEYLDNFPKLKSFKNCIRNESFLEQRFEYDLTAICRFQRILVELIGSHSLEGVEAVEVKVDFHKKIDWLNYAISDFKNLYDLLRFYFPKSNKFPVCEFTLVENFSKQPGKLTIDLSIFETWHGGIKEIADVSLFNSLLQYKYLPLKKDQTKGRFWKR